MDVSSREDSDEPEKRDVKQMRIVIEADRRTAETLALELRDRAQRQGLLLRSVRVRSTETTTETERTKEQSAQ